MRGRWMLWGLAACTTTGELEAPPDSPVPTALEPSPPDAPAEAPVARSVPLYGGTMAVAGTWLVVADPSRDVVGFEEDEAMRTVFLERGAEPFRVALGEERAFVTLRGTGEVARFARNGNAQLRAAVCDHPRGVAIESPVVYVACAGGEVVRLDADSLETIDRTYVAPDLRDVVPTSSGILVSRFRSAEVLRLHPTDLSWLDTMRPRANGTDRRRPAPRVAWRMVPHPDGGALLLHQAHRRLAVDLDATNDPSANPYGGAACDPSDLPLVTQHLTRITDQGTTLTGAPLGGVVLATDVAITDGGSQYVVAARAEGQRDQSMFGRVSRVHVETSDCATMTSTVVVPGQITSVALRTNNRAVGFERHAGQVLAANRGDPSTSLLSPPGLWIRLPEARLFHNDPGAGLACASCHPEGQDDGHVWTFEGLGPRRTQSLSGGLTQRGHFHWDAEFDSLSELMHDVFGTRMGGGEIPEHRIDELGVWLDGVEPVSAVSPDAPETLDLGQALFESPEVGCTDCHHGPDLSDHALHAIGSDRPPRKTPSLRGVGTRAPYMSDGCAPTLMDRFTDVDCGGDRHGATQALDSEELQALVSYVSTL